MTIAPRLFELYRRRGFSLLSGLNPTYFDGHNNANFTWLIKNGESWTNGLGIALQEVYFLETLFADFHPRRVLIIGNSFGWSALAIALANPGARVIAMDAGFDQNSLKGIELTNELAADAGLKLRAVKGVSPQDVAFVAREFGGAVDFAFIDGLHNNEQVLLDWRAIHQVAAPDAVFLFHDVYAWNLHDGIGRIRAESGLDVKMLMATPSGMALAYPAALESTLAPALSVFAPPPEAIQVLETAVARAKLVGRTLYRWRRSLRKRKDALNRRLGRSAPT